jgi:hypothetical protein
MKGILLIDALSGATLMILDTVRHKLEFGLAKTKVYALSGSLEEIVPRSTFLLGAKLIQRLQNFYTFNLLYCFMLSLIE